MQAFGRIRLPRDTAVGIHSLPEADELRDPSWQASPYHEGILHSVPEAEEHRDPCMVPRGGSAGSLMADMTGHGKFHSLPAAEEPRD